MPPSLDWNAHSVRHNSLMLTWVEFCERPEVNCESNHFLNNGKAFSSLDNKFSFSYGTDIQKPWDHQKPNLLHEVSY